MCCSPGPSYICLSCQHIISHVCLTEPLPWRCHFKLSRPPPSPHPSVSNALCMPQIINHPPFPALSEKMSTDSPQPHCYLCDLHPFSATPLCYVSKVRVSALTTLTPLSPLPARRLGGSAASLVLSLLSAHVGDLLLFLADLTECVPDGGEKNKICSFTSSRLCHFLSSYLLFPAFPVPTLSFLLSLPVL